MIDSLYHWLIDWPPQQLQPMTIAIAIAIAIVIDIAMTSALAIAIAFESVQTPSDPSIPLAGAPLRPRPSQSGLPQWFTAHREGRTSYRSTLAGCQLHTDLVS